MAKVKIKKEQLEAKISSRSPLTQTVVLRVLGVFFPPSLIKFNGQCVVSQTYFNGVCYSGWVKTLHSCSRALPALGMGAALAKWALLCYLRLVWNAFPSSEASSFWFISDTACKGVIKKKSHFYFCCVKVQDRKNHCFPNNHKTFKEITENVRERRFLIRYFALLKVQM